MSKARTSARTTDRAARIRGIASVRPTSTNTVAGRKRPMAAIRLVTLSPEWPEAPHYIETLVSDGVVVSIGHTKATAEQIQDAVQCRAPRCPHTSATARTARCARHPNYIWDQLAEDRLSAGFIVDGITSGRRFVKVALRAKGVARSVLVTDASMPAWPTPGIYDSANRMWN